MDRDLKWIKAKYGEKMMHLCRDIFPNLLETPGVVPTLLENHFHKYKFLAEDIIAHKKVDDFKGFVFSLIDVEKNNQIVNVNQSAVELMDKAGYILYPECKTEADIQAFRHYYYRKDGKTPVYNGGKPEKHQGEELCTFNGGKLETCRVWFAVKKNADEIKREFFKKPNKQDKYGTSVISIQFTRGKNSTLSIKNRYNHYVNNPDNTFDSNLDNIIEGLSDAFARDYGVRDFLCTCRAKKFYFDLPGYVFVNDGKYYPYNHFINNIYYCPDNIIINKYNVRKLPTHQILADYFIIDCKAKTVSLYDELFSDCFVDDISHNEKIVVDKDNAINIKKRNGGNAVIKLNQKNQIVGYTDDNLTECEWNFLCRNKTIAELNLPNLQKCGPNFCEKNQAMKVLNLEQLSRFGFNFFRENMTVEEVNLPRIKKGGYGCFQRNPKIRDMIAKKLEKPKKRILILDKLISKFTMIKDGREK